MITTVLFDFDGVIAHTEPQYDAYTEILAERYHLGIPDFATKVKGTTATTMLAQYFGHLPQEEHTRILEELAEVELHMDFPPVPGAIAFMEYLHGQGYQIGLVTSSPETKMQRALGIMGIGAWLHTQVTANRITAGKPHPMCYLLAAADLGALPEQCLVFEDSFNGIASALSAGMRVVGVSTSIAPRLLGRKVDRVIPDFTNKDLLLTFLQ